MQEISGLARNPNVHYSVQNSPLLFSILSQMDPIHVLILHFLKMHFNSILPSTPWITSFHEKLLISISGEN
jgi:hypothetical protein